MATACGIDIGRGSATAAIVRKRGASLALERLVTVSLAELTKDGVAASDPVKVAKAFAARLKVKRFSVRAANLGVSGKDAIIRYAHLPPMPPWRLALVMKYDLDEAAEKTGAPLCSDFRIVSRGEDGMAVVLVAMAKDESVTQWVKTLSQAGMDLGSASPRPTASGDAYRFLDENASSGTTLLLDVGRSSTEVAIVRSGNLIFARSVAQGGDLITERVAKQLSIEKTFAEECKVAGKGPDGEDLSSIMAPAVEQLASVVKASLDFARSQLKEPKLAIDRVAVTGGAARTKGLVEAMGKTAGVPAELFDPLTHIDLSPLPDQDRSTAEERGLEATAACGLALARLLPAALSLDLLPNAVKAQREWRHRTIFLYGAAGVLVLYVIMAGIFALIRSSKEGQRQKDLNARTSEVDARNKDREDLAEKNAARERNLALLAAKTKAGYYLSALLDTLARRLPERASISELELVPPGGQKGENPGGGVSFKLKGSLDNPGTDVDADKVLRDFQTQMTNDDPVRWDVELRPTTMTPHIEFTLVMKPKGA